jgi:hypothetical protein
LLSSYITDALKNVISDKTQSKNLLENIVFPSIKQLPPLLRDIMIDYENEINMILNISRIILILNLVFLCMKILFFIYKRFK